MVGSSPNVTILVEAAVPGVSHERDQLLLANPFLVHSVTRHYVQPVRNRGLPIPLRSQRRTEACFLSRDAERFRRAGGDL